VTCSVIRSDECREANLSLYAGTLRVKLNSPAALLQDILNLFRRRVDEFEPVNHPGGVPDDCGHFPATDRFHFHQFPDAKMIPN